MNERGLGMNMYDVVIVGGATTGSFFARRLAERGRSVLVLEKLPEDRVGGKYDIFHIAKGDFARFGLPVPVRGDDLAFEFTGGAAYSAFGNYPKESEATTVGMHMHAYTLRMNRWAREAGAEFRYGAEFAGFIWDGGRIAGVKFTAGGREECAGARLVADCSGIPSAARTKLPDGYGAENFAITPTDMFYVTLHYVKYLDDKDCVKRSRAWPYYKTWEAPEADPRGAILGVGANFSYEYGEKVFGEFESRIPLPRHELKYVERGTTPYRRPPYSFVADGFVAMGDAACLSKPHAGEGVTSSMVQAEIAADVIDGALGGPGPLTRERLWGINKRYVEAQGKTYAGVLATLIGAVSSSAAENDFFFRHDVVFSKKSFDSMAADKPLAFTFGETLKMAGVILAGLLSGKVGTKTVRSLLKGMQNGNAVSALYAEYPETPEGFEAWAEKADRIWKQCGSMADAASK
jgi:digeranylgeranylglycerophospholipid reductase